MKKLLTILLTLAMVIGITACQSQDVDTNNPNENTNLEGSLENILDKIYETVDVDDSMKDYLDNRLATTEITAENVGYYLGKDDIVFESAIASEPMMTSSAYSLCLLRVKEGADIEAIKKDIKDNVDPRKWICVGVDPANVIVDNIGDVVVLIMSDDAGSALHDAFLQLKEK